MKKIILAVLAILVLAGGGAAAWWKFGRARDPLSNAQVFLEKGDTRSALIELRNAVRLDPANPVAHQRLGMLQLNMGDAVAAEKELKAARDNGSKAPDLGVLIAQSYVQQGMNKEMLAEFRPPAATPELTSQLLILRSFAQQGLGDPAAAKISMDAAEAQAPNSPNAPLAAARLAFANNDLVTAEQKINRAIQLAPKRPDVLMLRGQILNGKGDAEGALQSLDAAIELAPKFGLARLERANIRLTLNRDAAAREDVDVVLAGQPNSAGGTYLLAVLLTRAKNDIGADAEFQKLSGVMARYPRSYYFQAIAKYNLGQVEQATDSVVRYVQRYPSDPEGVKLLARILLSSGRTDRAVEALTGAVRSGVADADTLDLLGRAYAISGRTQQAVRSFDEASTLAPENVDILSRLAAARLDAGDAAGAASDLQRSLALQPGRANTAEALVVAALAAGDVDQASKALDTLRSQTGAGGATQETVGLLNTTLLIRQQNLAAARAQLDDLIKANPRLMRARIQLAQVLVLQGQQAEAEGGLVDILKQEPANGPALSALLRLYLKDNRLDRAQPVLEAALSAAPTSEPLVLALCDLYVRAGAPEKSVALLDKIQKAAPPSPTPPNLQEARARAQMALKQPQEAIATLRRLLTQVPGNPIVTRQLVGLQIETKDWSSARGTVREALQLRPSDMDMLRLLVSVDRAVEGDQAARATIARLQADPVTRDAARILLADYEGFSGRNLESAKAYEALAQATPSTPLILSAVSAYNAAGQPQAAQRLLRDWLSRQPNDAEAAGVLARYEITDKRYDAARDLLEKVVMARPSDAEALNNLAWLYQRTGDARALGISRRAFLLRPNAEAADTLGWILTRQGKPAEAEPLLRQAAADLADPGVQFHYATALKDLGKREPAMEILRKLASRAEPFDEQADARKMLSEL
jgi:putative PEP-CTERM system TPR-repeat lipoprotein